MRNLFLAAVIAGATLTQPAHAALNVFACEPEWGALALELGGDNVSIYTATTGLQDPHQVQARPSLIAKARAADITVCTGAELETAWLPMVVHKSANANIKAGSSGSFEAASFVRLLDVPAKLDRAEGDVHPAGNPHIQTDPRNILIVAKALSARFVQLDAASAPAYEQRLADFTSRWTASLTKWEAAAAPLNDLNLVRADIPRNMTGPELLEVRRKRGALDVTVDEFYTQAATVDGLITDYPDRALPILAAKGLKTR